MALKLLECGDRVGLVGESAFAAVGGEPDQLIRAPERKGAQQDGIDHAENGDVRADSEGQHEDDDAGEGTVAAQGAEGEAQVLAQQVERRQAAGFAMLLHGAGDTAEADERRAARLFGRHAEAKIVLDGGVEVGGDLGVEVAIERRAAKDGEDAVPGAANGIDHHLSPSEENARTRPMTPVNFRQ